MLHCIAPYPPYDQDEELGLCMRRPTYTNQPLHQPDSSVIQLALLLVLCGRSRHVPFTIIVVASLVHHVICLGEVLTHTALLLCRSFKARGL